MSDPPQVRGRDLYADAERDGLPQRAAAGHNEARAAQLAAGAEEAALQFLDRGLAERALEHRLRAVAADQSVARQCQIAQRAAPDPLLVAAGVHLVGVHPHREHRAHERAHAHTRHAVDRHPRGDELLQHADVRERAGTASRQHDADRVAGQPPRHAGQIRFHLGAGA